MQFFGGFAISQMSLFFGIETAEIYNFFVMGDLRFPLFIWAFDMDVIANALQAMFVAMFAIGSILAVIGLAQIFKSVVRFVFVYMVNLTLRHSTSDVKPNNPVSSIMFPINFQIDVSFVVQVPGFLANSNARSRLIPIQKACRWIISEYFGKFQMCKHMQYYPVVN